MSGLTWSPGVAASRGIARLLLVAVLLAAAFIYRPGLQGPFMFDDGVNVVNNEHLKLQDLSTDSLRRAAFSVPNGVFGRPVSMLSFAVNYYIDRDKIEPFPTAYAFKLTNLAIHLLAGIAVFVATALLMALYRERRRPDLPAAYPEWLALAVAAAWVLHPLNLTSVLYVVQRMASLAALFSFAGLALYFWGRARVWRGQRGGMLAIAASVVVFTPLAVLSKDNGLLLPVLILAAEAMLFRFEAPQAVSRKFLIGFFVLAVAIPALFVIGYAGLHLDFLLAGYAKRDFSLTERLMTEARVLWFYLRLIVLPSTALMGVYHDDIAISRHLFDPATTLPAILGILALPIAAWLLARRAPLVAFGIVFFLVGHSLESSFYPLELVHEHRNYLPMFGILLGFFHLLLHPLMAVTTKLPRRALACLLIPLFAIGTWSRANDWSSAGKLWTAEVDHHPASIRANIALADLYAESLSFDPVAAEANRALARQHYEHTLELDKYNTNALFGLIQLNLQQGKPPERAWLAKLEAGLENGVIPPNTNDHLIGLAMCKTQEKCPLGAGEIEQLIRAAARNRKMTGRETALIYNALAVYHFHVARDYSAALEATRKAIELEPAEMAHQLWLANILIAMRRSTEARMHIAHLRQLDTSRVKEREIAILEERLMQAQ